MKIHCMANQYKAALQSANVLCQCGADRKECYRCGWNSYEHKRRLDVEPVWWDGLLTIRIPNKKKEWRGWDE